MSYSFAPNLARLVPSSTQTFALVDAAQIPGFAATLERKLPTVPYAFVFEETFAKSALNLSPVLIELSDIADTYQEQLLLLDALCKHLPVMGILHSTLTLQDLLQHLRELLRIEADGTAYLLRFVDSQMLVAINSILNPKQRANFFNGIHAWYVVDHQGCLQNVASGAEHTQNRPAASLPLQLDAEQTHALLTATTIPTLASQVRNQDSSFAEQLTHAQQCAFIDDCLAAAQAAWLDENEWPQFAQQRWQAVQEQHP